MLTLAELRQRHPTFFFDQAEVAHQGSELQLLLKYHFENGPSFTTTLKFPSISAELFSQKDPHLVQHWATQIGMVEGLSYWKAACSPAWVINVPGIQTAQLPFWESLLKKGLSEFFFIHQIDAWQDEFVTFSVTQPDAPAVDIDTAPHQERFLIPVGGGKDSAVTLDLLKRAGLPITTFSVNMYPQLQRVLDVYWDGNANQNHLQINRQIDPQLIELNTQGYLNGHTPFSAMIAFISTLAAYLYDFKYVPLSNEWSANEGNTVFLGQSINHQYSKTVEFEALFREYQHRWLSSSIEYFSFLRSLHELQIAELFITTPKYLPVFLSCNRGQKQGLWCGECPKCLFVAIMLAAFLPPKNIHEIFQTEILNNMALKDTFDQLLGFTEVKSLECVGTRRESQAAVALAAKNNQQLPALLDYGWQRLLSSGQTAQQLFQDAQSLRHHLATDHFVPPAFQQLIADAIEELPV